jgi:hypothetical protein
MISLLLHSMCTQRQCFAPAAPLEHQTITSLSCLLNKHMTYLKPPNSVNNIFRTIYSNRQTRRIVPLASNNENSPPPPPPPPPPAPRRALGVDYGRKFIGLAVSTLGLAPRPIMNMRGGGLDMLMELAQGIVDTAIAESKFDTATFLPSHLNATYIHRDFPLQYQTFSLKSC